ncbi:MAG: phosphoribosyltransferase [archaeon]
MLNSEDLALELAVLVEDFNSPVLVGSGGVMTYTLMTRLGYNKDPKIIGVKRKYIYEKGQTRPKISFSVNGNYEGKNFIDDIIASGATISQFGENLRCASLLLSSQTRGEYRTKQGSTIKSVDDLFVIQRVNSRQGFPAIFSSRFLVKQIRDNPEYMKYVSKYADTLLLTEVIQNIDRKPFDLLYENPTKFIQTYGG